MKFECAHDELAIFLNGQTCFIDKKDLALFARHAWYPVKKHKVWYLVRNGPTGSIYFHREVFNKIDPDLEVDHINGNGLDNRKTNLRIVTHQANQNNQRNRSKDGFTSKYTYVHWCSRDKKWMSMVSYNNKTKNLGRFKSQEEAALAANRFIKENKLNKLLVNL